MLGRKKPKELTSKELKRLTKGSDQDKPPLLRFLLIEGFEWTVYGLVIYLVYIFTKPIWLNLAGLFR